MVCVCGGRRGGRCGFKVLLLHAQPRAAGPRPEQRVRVAANQHSQQSNQPRRKTAFILFKIVTLKSYLTGTYRIGAGLDRDELGLEVLIEKRALNRVEEGLFVLTRESAVLNVVVRVVRTRLE